MSTFDARETELQVLTEMRNKWCPLMSDAQFAEYVRRMSTAHLRELNQYDRVLSAARREEGNGDA